MANQFGQGSRTCIGKNISLLEMNKCIPHILQRFDFELEHLDKVPESTNHWFVKQKEVQMRIRVRR
jgi:cytochrome P450